MAIKDTGAIADYNMGAVTNPTTGRKPARGPAGSIRIDADRSTKYELDFEGDTTSLANIDTQAFMRDVIHEVQTENSIMRPYVTTTYLKGTFEWRNLTPQRNPQARKSAIPDLNPRRQTFTTFGITVNPYDDDAWLVDATEKNSRISVGMTIVKAMEMGFERLYDKIAFSSMLVPVRMRTTTPETGDVDTSAAPVELPADRIGGRVTGGNAQGVVSSGNPGKLADPTFQTLVSVGLKFRNENVPYTTRIYASLTPNMERILYGMTEYNDKDYIFARRDDSRKKVLEFAGFHWVSVTPEVAPGAFYADRFLKQASGNLVTAENKGNAGGGGRPDLGTFSIGQRGDIPAVVGAGDAHEVIPFWVKENVFVGECPQLDMFEIFKVPFKRQTPIVVRTKWLGASRAQNKLQFNMVVPWSQ